MTKSFRKINTPDENLMRVQSAIAEVVDPLTRLPLLNTTLIQNVAIGTSPTAVAHGLNRQPLGFWVVDKTITTDVWRSVSAAPGKLLMLQAGTATTISIIVF